MLFELLPELWSGVEPGEPVLGLADDPDDEPPIEPEDSELPVEPVDDPELPEEEPPSEPLEPVSEDPELPECFEELPEEPFGMTSMFVTSEPEKLART